MLLGFLNSMPPNSRQKKISDYLCISVKRTFISAKKFPFHPYLFIAYPILYLYANNISEIEISHIIRPSFISFILVSISLLILRALLTDSGKSTLIITVGIILFFSYGHIYQLTGTLEIFGEPIGRHRYLLPLAFAIFSVWSWWVFKQKRDKLSIHRFFNLVGIILLLIPIAIIGKSFLGRRAAEELGAPSPQITVVGKSDEKRPDVYYIVLDGYGRQDVLQDLYNLDNSTFLKSLESQGFYIVDEGYSNYMQTLLSLASSLNMDYLSGYDGWETRTRNDLDVFRGLIRHSEARKVFNALGYRLVAFETGYSATNIPDADVYLSVEDALPAGGRFVVSINEFEDILLNSSLAVTLRALQTKTRIFDTLLIEDPFSRHRERIRYILSTLGEIPTWEGEYFIIAHIISPHPPFVFDEVGAPVNPEGHFTLADGSNYSGGRDDYIQQYRHQLIYLNSLLKETVNQILASSEPDPIIILQADHGPGAYLETNSMVDSNLTERLAIFHAYYLPIAQQDALYPSITPVNSFRLILNEYFEFSYPLLEDKSYFATWRRPFLFADITDVLFE